MKIGKEEFELQSFPNFKGGEGHLDARMFYDGNVRLIMDGTLHPGCSIGLHRHQGSMEIIYIIKGTGTAICEGHKEQLFAGDVHYCNNGEEHTLRNDSTEDLVFFAVVPNLK